MFSPYGGCRSGNVYFKVIFIFDVLIAYLYVLCAIYFIYIPIKKVFLNKLDKKEKTLNKEDSGNQPSQADT